ncbi:unnamed protein product [Urochloa humidicola]
MSSPAAPLQCLPTEQHCRRQYGLSVWGDFFLNYQPCTPEELLSMEEKARAMKESVRLILVEVGASVELQRKLDFVDQLERLGVGYHYKKEIDELLCAVYHDKDGGSSDLYVTSLRFYLLRKHGYAVSSDVFVQFRDDEGNISSDDMKSVMMLYDAAHLRIQDEEILDNIISFNRSHLLSMIKTTLEPAILEEVKCTLDTPRFRRVERVEARRFILEYEKNVERDDTILEFAKLDYSIMQVLYCKELKELTIWWNEFQSQSNLKFARDRIVEMFFWMMAIIYEPCYSYSRIWVTKLVISLALMDDVYDNYTSTEESKIFTTAMERLAKLTIWILNHR